MCIAVIPTSSHQLPATLATWMAQTLLWNKYTIRQQQWQQFTSTQHKRQTQDTYIFGHVIILRAHHWLHYVTSHWNSCYTTSQPNQQVHGSTHTITKLKCYHFQCGCTVCCQQHDTAQQEQRILIHRIQSIITRGRIFLPQWLPLWSNATIKTQQFATQIQWSHCSVTSWKKYS